MNTKTSKVFKLRRTAVGVYVHLTLLLCCFRAVLFLQDGLCKQ
jgi:hypothetical protein